MAISDQVPGLEVCVHLRDAQAHIGQEKATEYNEPRNNVTANDDEEVRILASATEENSSVDINVSDQRHVVKYIEVKEGQFFSFRIDIEPTMYRPSHHVMVLCEADGEEIGYWRESRTEKQKHDHSRILAVKRLSQKSGEDFIVEYFRFKDLVLDREEAECTVKSKKIMWCGVLKVKLYHMCYSAVRVDKSGHPGSNIRLSEKDLKGKALSLQVDMQRGPDKMAAKTNMKRVYHDPQQRPFATFEFRYRTKDGLMQEGIIPRPTLAEKVRDMSEADVRQELLRQLENEERRSADMVAKKEEPRIKTESSDVQARGVKRERSEADDLSVQAVPQYKERRLADGRFEVDLTD